MTDRHIRGKASAKALLENTIRSRMVKGTIPPAEDPWARLDRYTDTRERLEAERKEQEALSAPKRTTAEVIWNELGHSSTDIPLNGAGVLRAALASLSQGST